MKPATRKYKSPFENGTSNVSRYIYLLTLVIFMAQREIKRSLVVAFFERSPHPIFWPSDLVAIFRRYRSIWGFPTRFSPSDFVKWMIDETKMHAIELECADYPSITRFVWDSASTVAIALSLQKDAYLSHGSALWGHGLRPDHGQIYINHEQSEKPPNEGSLTQEAINKAFGRPPRETKLIYKMPGAIVRVLSGKHTGRLEVRKSRIPSGEVVPITSLERTLVDIVVRPNYAGGVEQVARVFGILRGQISIKRLANTLRALDYTYPYHQAVGFYLKHAGYAGSEQRVFAKHKRNFDFYLCNAISDAVLDLDWRIFYPRTLANRATGRT